MEPQSASNDLEALQRRADQGNALAQQELGLSYLVGDGVPQDPAQAAIWYRKAALQGNAEAQKSLGVQYLYGFGVPKDYIQAAEWTRRAADQGHSVAQCTLGQLYKDGRGVKRDSVQSAFWYRKSAEQGNDNAQYELGLIYENGEGVPLDDAQAIFWYRKAADQEHPEAQEKFDGLRFRSDANLDDFAPPPPPRRSRFSYLGFLTFIAVLVEGMSTVVSSFGDGYKGVGSDIGYQSTQARWAKRERDRAADRLANAKSNLAIWESKWRKGAACDADVTNAKCRVAEAEARFNKTL